MSAAVVYWWLLGRPEALRNWVLRMPSWWAVRVMRRAKAGSEPSMFSPTVEATSLADLVTSARMASRTLIVSPGRSPTLEGGMPEEWREALSGVSSDMRPASSSSNRM